MKPIPIKSLCALLPAAAALVTSAQAQPDYAPAIWHPCCNANWYTSGNGHKFCVIHDMEGYYGSTVSYFTSCGHTSSSVYYAVNGLAGDSGDGSSPAGEISQMVREAYYAWHACCWNQWMFGTEHEGFASNPAWYTVALYQASAGLQTHLCNANGIPKDRNHIIGHGEWQNANWKSWMAANFPSINTSCNTHTDPGPYWNWNYFMNLINGTPPPPPVPRQVQFAGFFNGNASNTNGIWDFVWRPTGWSSWAWDESNGSSWSFLCGLVDNNTGFSADPTQVACVKGDFNGDGITDIAWRPKGWTSWLVDLGGPNGGTLYLADGRTDFDPAIDACLVGDFNGDGKADIAWRPKGWTSWAITWGGSGGLGWLVDNNSGFDTDLTKVARVVGDFDGDGKSDIAWRPNGWSSWMVAYGNGNAGCTLADGNTNFNASFAYLAGKFDRNHTNQSAIAWRPTGWTSWMLDWGTGYSGTAFADGNAGFTADPTKTAWVAGDFDGDGVCDIAWRPTGWTSWMVDYGNGSSGSTLVDGQNFNASYITTAVVVGHFSGSNKKQMDIGWRPSGWSSWCVNTTGGFFWVADGRTDFSPY